MSDYFTGPLPGQLPTAPASTAAPAWQGQPAPGYRPAGAPSPAAPPGWPPYTGGNGLSGGALAAVIVAAVVGVIVVMGILAAIAIPVFLNQRAKAEAANTTVFVPEQLVGLTRLHDARAQRMEQSLRSQPGNPETGVFGDGGAVRAAVSVTRQSMSSKDDQDFLRGAENSFSSLAAGSWQSTQPGRLGGFARCAIVTSPSFSVCLFADHGAFGSITLFGPLVGRDDVAMSIREAVEHRS